MCAATGPLLKSSFATRPSATEKRYGAVDVSPVVSETAVEGGTRQIAKRAMRANAMFTTDTGLHQDALIQGQSCLTGMDSATRDRSSTCLWPW
jgi:hypothetical protein